MPHRGAQGAREVITTLPDFGAACQDRAEKIAGEAAASGSAIFEHGLDRTCRRGIACIGVFRHRVLRSFLLSGRGPLEGREDWRPSAPPGGRFASRYPVVYLGACFPTGLRFSQKLPDSGLRVVLRLPSIGWGSLSAGERSESGAREPGRGRPGYATPGTPHTSDRCGAVGLSCLSHPGYSRPSTRSPQRIA